jgi:DNA polymerase-3 subunit gamma/tau
VATNSKNLEQEYTVVARRYRPQQFADLVGQETVAKAITNAIKSDRVAHAYLFTGPRGVGKTSTARIIAKCLNCVTGPTPTPCDRCDICLSIMAGQDLDVLEIDGASNRGIDDARALREGVATRPTRSRYKIYIIDEVHMFTREAFNALLKTLEEPPPHVKFILATTDVQKVPITILSRCQRFDLGGISANKIALHLQKVMAKEGLPAEEEALRMIARRAGGSMRDAQSLLEQLLAGAEGGKLTTEHVRSVLGAAAEERVVEIAEAILSQDAGKALTLVKVAAEEGVQLIEVLDELTMFWRGLMLAKVSGVGSLDDLSELQQTSIAKLLEGVHLDTILAGLDILSTAKTRLKAGAVTQIVLEMTLVRLSRLGDLIPLTQLAEALSRSGGMIPIASSGQTNVAHSTEAAKKNGSLMVSRPPSAKNSSTSWEANPNEIAIPLTAANLESVWLKVLEHVGPMLRANLEKAGLPQIPQASTGPKVLVLRFPVRYNTAFEFCKSPDRAQGIENALRKITAQDWAVRVEIDSSPQGGTTSEAPVLSPRDMQKQALEHPLLSQIVTKLEGRLMRMDEGFGQPYPTQLDRES